MTTAEDILNKSKTKKQNNLNLYKEEPGIILKKLQLMKKRIQRNQLTKRKKK